MTERLASFLIENKIYPVTEGELMSIYKQVEDLRSEISKTGTRISGLQAKLQKLRDQITGFKDFIKNR
jgi:peptidoglycan hydrolase CwlO-like protein